MKSFLRYSLAIAIASLTMSANPAHKAVKQTSVSVYVANGTAFYGTLKIASALNFNYHPTDYQYAGQITTGTAASLRRGRIRLAATRIRSTHA